MSSSQEHSNGASYRSDGTLMDCTTRPSTLTVLDRYTALRNHRMRFKDALDPNAQRVTILRKHDIIFGRGKNMQDYPGNRRMRSIINKYKNQYHSIQRSEKRDLIESVYKELIRGGARFLTKAPDDEHFVVVDIEVALQKVGNTLRCRKNRNKKMKTSANINGEMVCAPLETKKDPDSSEHETPVMATARAPQMKTSSQIFTRLPEVPPPLTLGRRSQTMSLLRENTIRLMQQLPLRPATAGDVFYLHKYKSPWHPYQLHHENSQSVIVAVTKNRISLRANANVMYTGGHSVSSTPGETAGGNIMGR